MTTFYKQYEALGQSQISRLGLGTVKFGRNQGVKYPKSFQLPKDSQITELLSIAQSLGINLIDTAPAYGRSEERLGKLLKSTDRQQWIICSKAGEEFDQGISHFNFIPSHIQHSLERSLKRLNTDYLDIFLLHSDGQDDKLMAQEDIFALLEKFKQQGKIRCYGASTKTVSGGLKALAQSDCVMVTHNLSYQSEKAVLQKAAKTKQLTLIKKALASGHLDQSLSQDPVQSAFDSIFATPGVGSIILGTINPKHLEENVKKAKIALNQSLSK